MPASIQVFIRREEESWSAFARRIGESDGHLMIVLSPQDVAMLKGEDRDAFLKSLQKLQSRVRLATKDLQIVHAARRHGLRVIDRVMLLRTALRGNEQQVEALRTFSPHLWRQQLRSNLQAMGLLSLPKIRIWFLIGLSVILFLFVLLRLLPSADIRVWPRQDIVSQTANIFLVLSGAQLDLHPRVRRMELIPIKVSVQKSITLDQISKEFIGKSADVRMTVINVSKEPYTLKKATRLQNQAGMLFRLKSELSVEPGQQVQMMARAEPEDLYGVIIGERGNVPANLRWDFPGLSPEEQKSVYAINPVAAVGGTTAFRKLLQQKDLDIGKRQLEQELLADAKRMIEEQRDIQTVMDAEAEIRLLQGERYESLTRTYYYDFQLPEEFMGQEVTTVPISGKLDYKMFGYDAQAILVQLKSELHDHTEYGRRLLEERLSLDNLVVHVIDYADDLSWIKLTVDLTGTEEFLLDPLTKGGLAFGRKVREAVANKTIDEALRIVRNFPEVEKVDISVWPPWKRSLPSLPANIRITPERAD